MPSANKIVRVKFSGNEPYDPVVLCFFFHMSVSSPTVWEGRGLSFATSLFSILVTRLDSIEVKLKFQKR